MTNLLRSEWIKFRSVRSTLVVLALAGALVVLVAVLAANDKSNDTSGFDCVRPEQAEAAGDTPIQDPELQSCDDGGTLHSTVPKAHLTDITVGVTIATLLFGVLGVQVVGQEYRFNTIRPTFTATPRRLPVLLAKWAVVCSACAAVSAVMVAFCWLVGTVMLDDFRVDGVDQRAAFGIVVFTIGFTTLGMGVGAILRQPIAAIPLLLGEAFVAENIIGAIARSTWKWLPFTNGIQMTIRSDGSEGSQDLQSVTAGGTYFLVVALVAWAIGAFLVNKRDA